MFDDLKEVKYFNKITDFRSLILAPSYIGSENIEIFKVKLGANHHDCYNA